MRYFEVEIFSGWSLDIYSFYKELDCWSGNICWSLSWPLCFTVGCLKWQTIWYYFYHFGKFTDDSELIYVTTLNVTEDVAMIFHMGNLPHLLQLVVTLFLWLFWYISLSSASDGKENGDIFENYPLSETSILGTAIWIGWMLCKMFACNCLWRITPG